ncbi:hypothetical protein BU17DRAFT_103107 [Hysterangium stoloniferum]|nr:hypothetical protein BU17DRAFT_103107 [Hysterangium stoloniferum]
MRDPRRYRASKEVIGIEESPLERNDEMSARDRLAIRIRELSKSGIGGGDDGDGDDDSGGSVAGKNLTPKVREVGLIRPLNIERELKIKTLELRMASYLALALDLGSKSRIASAHTPVHPAPANANANSSPD